MPGRGRGSNMMGEGNEGGGRGNKRGNEDRVRDSDQKERITIHTKPTCRIISGISRVGCQSHYIIAQYLSSCHVLSWHRLSSRISQTHVSVLDLSWSGLIQKHLK